MVSKYVQLDFKEVMLDLGNSIKGAIGKLMDRIDELAKSGPKKKPQGRRKSVIETDLGEFEFEEEEQNSAINLDEGSRKKKDETLKHEVEEREKGSTKQPEVIKYNLETVATKAPECPKINKLDDAGFRDLYDRYKAYLDEFKRIGIKNPKTIDHCIVNTPEVKWRNKFEYCRNCFVEEVRIPVAEDMVCLRRVIFYVVEAKWSHFLLGWPVLHALGLTPEQNLQRWKGKTVDLTFEGIRCDFSA